MCDLSFEELEGAYIDIVKVSFRFFFLKGWKKRRLRVKEVLVINSKSGSGFGSTKI